MPKPVRLTTIASDTAQVDEHALTGDAKAKLEQKLAQRPDTQELRERNILKSGFPSASAALKRADTSVAPALQAAQDKLQRSQLEVWRLVCTHHLGVDITPGQAE